MKTLLSFTLVTIFLFVSISNAQEQYTVDGKQYALKTEVEGSPSLLWNTIDGEYRYFIKKDNSISELKNTKLDGKYQEEYKATLQEFTKEGSTNTSKVNFTLPALGNYIIDYNKANNPNFKHESTNIQLNTRLGVFGGFTNSVFTSNPTNAFSGQAGVDFEVVDEVKLRRHSVVIRFKQTFENSDTKFSSSQLSLNYRFKFIKSERLDIFINTKFVSYTHSKSEFTIPDPTGGTNTITESSSGGSLQAPAAFGIGADFALGNGYLTICYNDIVAVGIENVDGNFPADVTLGYKFNL